jgi:hypothetical protein
MKAQFLWTDNDKRIDKSRAEPSLSIQASRHSYLIGQCQNLSPQSRFANNRDGQCPRLF